MCLIRVRNRPALLAGVGAAGASRPPASKNSPLGDGKCSSARISAPFEREPAAIPPSSGPGRSTGHGLR